MYPTIFLCTWGVLPDSSTVCKHSQLPQLTQPEKSHNTAGADSGMNANDGVFLQAVATHILFVQEVAADASQLLTPPEASSAIALASCMSEVAFGEYATVYLKSGGGTRPSVCPFDYFAICTCSGVEKIDCSHGVSIVTSESQLGAVDSHTLLFFFSSWLTSSPIPFERHPITSGHAPSDAAPVTISPGGG